MFINRSFFSFIVASLLMLASSDVIAQEAGDALQPAGPISLTGLINGAAEPLSDSEAEATASNGSEASFIMRDARLKSRKQQKLISPSQHRSLPLVMQQIICRLRHQKLLGRS